MKLAILLGVSEYVSQTNLPACRNDADTLAMVLRKSGKYDDICHVSGTVLAAAGKKAITDFISKHQGAAVEEVLFFFSGHGARVPGDFLHIFSDYSGRAQETTSLRNSELDGLLRNLAPDLTVKIVDACFSGSQYIKAEDDVQPALEKSARDNSLKKLYFLHSSDATETSLAGPAYSVFTESVLRTISLARGELRYRDLMAGVADDLNGQSVPRPTFVVQADNLEKFLDVTEEIAGEVDSLLGAAASKTGTKDGVDATSESSNGVESGQTGLAAMASKYSRDVFCTQEEAMQHLALLNGIGDVSRWPAELRSVFDISSSALEADKVPNAESLGRWLLSKKSDNLFAQPTYRSEQYEVEEYKEQPKKPAGFRELFAIQAFLSDSADYKLVKVTKTRNVLTGVRFTAPSAFEPHVVSFSPKYPALENYQAHMLSFFSRHMMYFLYSIEHLPFTGWDTVATAQARDWKPLSAPLKDAAAIEASLRDVIADISDYIVADAKKRLESLDGGAASRS